jgi:gas vesicle protein
MNENGKILAALLGGAALGAVLGVLFAPGSTARGKIVDSSRGFTDNLRDRVDQVKDVITDLGEKIMGNAENELADLTERGTGSNRGSSMDNTGTTGSRGGSKNNPSGNNYNL